MQKTGNIIHLTRQELEVKKWDDRISHSTNGLVYAKSFYLDHITENWSALIKGDYEYVMPLPFRIKYGIRYVFTPVFCPNLGVFGNAPDLNKVEEFLESIPSEYKYLDLQLNGGNTISSQWQPRQRINQVLNLKQDYPSLFDQYRTSYKSVMKKGLQNGLRVERGIPIEDVIVLAKIQLSSVTGLQEQDYSRLVKVIQHSAGEMQVETIGVFNQQHALLASGLFFIEGRRAYYMLAGNHPDGRTLGASHLMLDAFIHDHAGQELELDFEGSDIPRIAFFFRSFGANDEYFPALTLNRLPWWSKWLK